jgi:hypothetical protein
MALIVGLLCFGATSVCAGGTHHAPSVVGKKARSQIRHFLYAKNLQNDKKVVFEKYGYTAHRIRINTGGNMSERWSYHSEGKEFTFDKYGNLIAKRDIGKTERRSWVYQK